jgi:hypothetical protein
VAWQCARPIHFVVKATDNQVSTISLQLPTKLMIKGINHKFRV